MNKHEFKAAYGKIKLSDGFKAEAKKKLVSCYEDKQDVLNSDDYEDQHASNSMIIQPKPRKPWKVIAGVGAAAAVVGLGVWGGVSLFGRSPIDPASNVTEETSHTVESIETIETTEPVAPEDKTVNILVYEMAQPIVDVVERFCPDYTDNGDNTGTLGDITIRWVPLYGPNVEGNYRIGVTDYIDDTSLPPEERADLIYVNDESVLYDLMGSGYTEDLYSIGLTTEDTLQMYDYTLKQAGGENGELYALAWEAAPYVFYYRRSIAEQVFGTSEPEEVQKLLSDWDSFTDAALKLKDQGYCMISDCDQLYELFCTDGWINSDDMICADDGAVKWAEICKLLQDNGCFTGNGMWTSEWADDLKGNKVFGGFALSSVAEWSILHETDVSGDFAVCMGPQSGYSEIGQWLAAARDTNSPEAVTEFLRALCCNEETAQAISTDPEYRVLANNVAAMDELAASDHSAEHFGGQNPFGVYSECAKSIKTDIPDTERYRERNRLSAAFNSAFEEYILGNVSYEDAMMAYREQALTICPGLQLVPYDERFGLVPTSAVFPAYYDMVNEYNHSIVFSAAPFKLDISLPEGWYFEEPVEKTVVFSPLTLKDENGETIGSVDFNTYEIYEGMTHEIDNYYRMVYNQLMLGSMVTWDYNFNVVKQKDGTCSATCQILVDERLGESGGYGILAHNDELCVYIQMSINKEELDPDLHAAIARSVNITPSEEGIAERVTDDYLEKWENIDSREMVQQQISGYSASVDGGRVLFLANPDYKNHGVVTYLIRNGRFNVLEYVTADSVELMQNGSGLLLVCTRIDPSVNTTYIEDTFYSIQGSELKWLGALTRCASNGEESAWWVKTDINAEEHSEITQEQYLKEKIRLTQEYSSVAEHTFESFTEHGLDRDKILEYVSDVLSGKAIDSINESTRLIHHSLALDVYHYVDANAGFAPDTAGHPQVNISFELPEGWMLEQQNAFLANERIFGIGVPYPEAEGFDPEQFKTDAAHGYDITVHEERYGSSADPYLYYIHTSVPSEYAADKSIDEYNYVISSGGYNLNVFFTSDMGISRESFEGLLKNIKMSPVQNVEMKSCSFIAPLCHYDEENDSFTYGVNAQKIKVSFSLPADWDYESNIARLDGNKLFEIASPYPKDEQPEFDSYFDSGARQTVHQTVIPYTETDGFSFMIYDSLPEKYSPDGRYDAYRYIVSRNGYNISMHFIADLGIDRYIFERVVDSVEITPI